MLAAYGRGLNFVFRHQFAALLSTLGLMVATGVLYAAIPNLTYLARGGRIGQLQSILGNVLKIVPIITLRDGEVAEFAKVRTFARAVDQIVSIAAEKIQSRGTARVAVLHSVAPDLADSVAARIEQAVAPAVLFKACIGPTVGTHAGPGAVGIAFAR
jgi:DegV family protein with EDD domain